MDVTTGAPPAVTVVMAAYNAQDHIARAIESVLAQSFAGWELICIDDGSTDATQSMIRAYAQRDPRIRLLSQDNAGPAEARRKGYVAARGAHVILLDADDWFGPTALEDLVDCARHADADAIMCRWLLRDGDTGAWVSFYERHGFHPGDRFTGRAAFAHTFPWRLHGVCLFRSAIIKTAATDPRDAFNGYNSDEFITRKLFLACRHIVLGRGDYFHADTPASLTRSLSWRKFTGLQTDRRLTDLALEEGIGQEVLAAVLDWQKDGLRAAVWQLARHGGDGRAPLAIREILRSLRHLRRAALRAGVGFRRAPFLLDIGGVAARGLARRWPVLRRVHRKLRPQT